MKKALFFILALPSVLQTTAQSIGVSIANATYSQNFDSLAQTGVSNQLPHGWHFYEIGNTLYADGFYDTDLFYQGTNPNIYSLGDDPTGNVNDPHNDPNPNPSDRAFGLQRDQNNFPNPRIGAEFTNTSDSAITGFQISYKGETWYRNGSVPGAPPIDTLAFYFRKRETTDSFEREKLNPISTIWTRHSEFDHILEAGLDTVNFAFLNYAGNLPANSKMISGTWTLPSSLVIAPGEGFYISWRPEFDNGNVTSIGGVDDLQITFFFGTSNGIASVGDGISVDAYPNPVADVLHISLKNATNTVNWSMVSTVGKVVKTGAIAPGAVAAQSIEVSDLVPGIYFIHFVTRDQQSKVIRFVRQ